MARKFGLMLAALGLVTTASVLLAQEKGPNGGLLGGTGAHKTELVMSPTQLTVYLLEDGEVHESKGSTFRLLEDGEVHESKGSTFRAVVQQGGKTKTINLTDEQGKRLVGELDAPLEKGAVVVLTGKDSHGDSFNARYVIK